MMASRLLLPLLILSISFSAEAQLYKWIGPDGKVNYSDTPPPKSITKVETKSLATSSGNNAPLPYDLAEAIKNMPVTLYTGDQCVPCDDGRKFLKHNGVPFSEKTITTSEDAEKFKQLTSNSQLPVLYIGKNKLLGFQPSDWRNSLTQAGYPEASKLPAEFHFSAPQPLVSPKVTPNQTNVPTNTNPPKTEPPTQDPNGFHF